jgi:hypothetical protein
MVKAAFPMRVVGFALVPALSAVSPLIALPAVTSVGGADVWGAIAIGQSLGLAGATIVELGWGLKGPQRLARTGESGRRRAMAMSFQTRGAVFPLVGLVAAALAWLLATDHAVLAAMMAFSSVATGLSLIWYFIGAGRPGKLLVTDSVPRVVLVIASALAIYNGAPLIAYPLVGVLLPAIVAPALGALSVQLSRTDFRGIGATRTAILIRAQFVAMSGRFVSALYIALPVALVGLVAPQAVPVFAAAERLQRMYLSILSAIPNAMQGWVGKSPNVLHRISRAEQSAFVNAGVGILAGVVFTIGAPAAAAIVFSGVVTVSTELAGLCGLVIFFVCSSRAVGGLVLVALNSTGTVLRSALVGALIGVPGILLLGREYGAPGALMGEIAAEAAVLAVQFHGWLSRRRRRPGK